MFYQPKPNNARAAAQTNADTARTHDRSLWRENPVPNEPWPLLRRLIILLPQQDASARLRQAPMPSHAETVGKMSIDSLAMAARSHRQGCQRGMRRDRPTEIRAHPSGNPSERRATRHHRAPVARRERKIEVAHRPPMPGVTSAVPVGKRAARSRARAITRREVLAPPARGPRSESAERCRPFASRGSSPSRRTRSTRAYAEVDIPRGVHRSNPPARARSAERDPRRTHAMLAGDERRVFALAARRSICSGERPSPHRRDEASRHVAGGAGTLGVSDRRSHERVQRFVGNTEVVRLGFGRPCASPTPPFVLARDQLAVSGSGGDAVAALRRARFRILRSIARPAPLPARRGRRRPTRRRSGRFLITRLSSRRTTSRSMRASSGRRKTNVVAREKEIDPHRLDSGERTSARTRRPWPRDAPLECIG